MRRDVRQAAGGDVMIAPTQRRAVSILVPAVTICLGLAMWEVVVKFWQIPVYVLPGPLLIAKTLLSDWSLLAGALGATIETTLLALVAAVVVGTLLAVIMSQSRWLEIAFFPYMIALQVTPIIAIAPLIVIWVSNIKLGLLICAWLVAFFPIVANTMTGLKSADHSLEDLFQLYGASRWQILWRLRLPAALPYFLTGLRIAGGLSLIGAIVAEFCAGTGGQGSGLAFQILQAGYQMNMPRLFAALFLISAAGLIIYLALAALSHFALRHWHETARRREQ
jgi:NitT/TauT family transport system permease protein